MKYGKRLGQYSVPEWGAHNILYEDIKLSIKDLTRSEESFTDSGYETLRDSMIEEVESTNLFVHCKFGELEYRFNQCDSAVSEMSKHGFDEAKFWQLSREVQKLREETQNLSRFVVAQYTGFRKLLKKYRRHAPHDKLAIHRDLHEVDNVLNARGSFARLDLTPQFLELSALYSILRTKQFDTLPAAGGESVSPANLLVQFDVKMLSTAVTDVFRFWVHPENLVQVKVLLLQHLDLVLPLPASSEPADDEETTHVLYLDTVDLSMAQSLRDPAQVRQVEALKEKSQLELLVPASGLRHTASSPLTPGQFEAIRAGEPVPRGVDTPAGARALGWVASKHVKPTASLRTHRTRFQSTANRVWAAIDVQAEIVQTNEGSKPHATNGGDNSVIEANGHEPTATSESHMFPYAVLELRVGSDVPWIDELRRSHLLYPVAPSFSLYAWALLVTKPDQVVARPGWFDDLASGRDIRRSPETPVIGATQQPSHSIGQKKSVASLGFAGPPSASDGNGEGNGSSRPRSGSNNDVDDGGFRPRYWNEFDDGDEEFGDDDGGFISTEDECVRRARVATRLTNPMYQLGESVRRRVHRLNSWFERRSSDSTLDSILDGQSIVSTPSETSSLRGGPYSPRIRPAQNYGAVNDLRLDPEARSARTAAALTYIDRRNDQGLVLITFLCFCLSIGIISLVYTILVTEDLTLLPSTLRAALVVFLVIALALALLGYVASNFRSETSWAAQALVHTILFSVVCVGIGGIVNITIPDILAATTGDYGG